MAETDIKEKLVDYVQDAHAMEDQVVLMLNSMIISTSDAAMKKQLERHLEETRQHAQRLSERLEALGSSSSLRKEAQNLPATMLKGMVDQMRTDKPGKNARDGFVTEHLEIAAYELLERLATRAGDKETAAVARRNRKDEEAMAARIAGTWDKVIDLTLKEAGISIPRTSRNGASRARGTSASRSRSTSASGSRSKSASRSRSTSASRSRSSSSSRGASSGAGGRSSARRSSSSRRSS
jgi:ferritin-like metal-binding protein YciE